MCAEVEGTERPNAFAQGGLGRGADVGGREDCLLENVGFTVLFGCEPLLELVIEATLYILEDRRPFDIYLCGCVCVAAVAFMGLWSSIGPSLRSSWPEAEVEEPRAANATASTLVVLGREGSLTAGSVILG